MLLVVVAAVVGRQSIEVDCSTDSSRNICHSTVLNSNSMMMLTLMRLVMMMRDRVLRDLRRLDVIVAIGRRMDLARVGISSWLAGRRGEGNGRGKGFGKKIRHSFGGSQT